MHCRRVESDTLSLLYADITGILEDELLCVMDKKSSIEIIFPRYKKQELSRKISITNSKKKNSQTRNSIKKLSINMADSHKNKKSQSNSPIKSNNKQIILELPVENIKNIEKSELENKQNELVNKQNGIPDVRVADSNLKDCLKNSLEISNKSLLFCNEAELHEYKITQEQTEHLGAEEISQNESKKTQEKMENWKWKICQEAEIPKETKRDQEADNVCIPNKRAKLEDNENWTLRQDTDEDDSLEIVASNDLINLVEEKEDLFNNKNLEKSVISESHNLLAPIASIVDINSHPNGIDCNESITPVLESFNMDYLSPTSDETKTYENLVNVPISAINDNIIIPSTTSVLSNFPNSYIFTIPNASLIQDYQNVNLTFVTSTDNDNIDYNELVLDDLLKQAIRATFEHENTCEETNQELNTTELDISATVPEKQGSFSDRLLESYHLQQCFVPLKHCNVSAERKKLKRKSLLAKKKSIISGKKKMQNYSMPLLSPHREDDVRSNNCNALESTKTGVKKLPNDLPKKKYIKKKKENTSILISKKNPVISKKNSNKETKKPKLTLNKHSLPSSINVTKESNIANNEETKFLWKEQKNPQKCPVPQRKESTDVPIKNDTIEAEPIVLKIKRVPAAYKNLETCRKAMESELRQYSGTPQFEMVIIIFLFLCSYSKNIKVHLCRSEAKGDPLTIF